MREEDTHNNGRRPLSVDTNGSPRRQSVWVDIIDPTDLPVKVDVCSLCKASDRRKCSEQWSQHRLFFPSLFDDDDDGGDGGDDGRWGMMKKVKKKKKADFRLALLFSQAISFRKKAAIKPESRAIKAGTKVAVRQPAALQPYVRVVCGGSSPVETAVRGGSLDQSARLLGATL